MPNLIYQESFVEGRVVSVEEELSISRKFPDKADAALTRAGLYMSWTETGNRRAKGSPEYKPSNLGSIL